MSKNHRLALSAVLFAAFSAACSDDPSDPLKGIDRTTDCSAICDKYKECFDNDYNVDKCHDNCADMTSDSDTDKIDDCESCIDDKSCASGAFSCATECAGIVP
jgi:hypothetical protein